MLRALARRCRRAADSRTCDTEPGAAESCSSQSVWIESTTQTSGAVASIVAQTVSSSVSASTPTPGRRADALGAQAHLLGRLLAGHEQHGALRADRAQHGRRQARLADARLAAEQHERPGHEPAAEHAVELGMPVPMRVAALVSTDASGTTMPGAAPRRRAPLRASSDAGACSTSVAKAPQSGQRPCQRDCSPPHSPQT